MARQATLECLFPVPASTETWSSSASLRTSRTQSNSCACRISWITCGAAIVTRQAMNLEAVSILSHRVRVQLAVCWRREKVAVTLRRDESPTAWRNIRFVLIEEIVRPCPTYDRPWFYWKRGSVGLHLDGARWLLCEPPATAIAGVGQDPSWRQIAYATLPGQVLAYEFRPSKTGQVLESDTSVPARSGLGT